MIRIPHLLLILSLFVILLSACSGKASEIPVATQTSTATPVPTTIPLTDTPATSLTQTPTASTSSSLADLSGLGQIAFKNDDYWYYVVNADGSNIYKLADPIGGGHYTDGQDCSFAAWSPTGAHLAVISDGNIFVLSTDGTSAQKILDTNDADLCIDWSPDGQYLAFSSYRAGVVERGVPYIDIFVVRPDGTDFRKITSSDKFCIHVDWSPTGTWLAFDCMWDGVEIYLSNRDGSQLDKLSQDNSSRNPVWSPDGTLIAYEGRGGSSDYSKFNIYVMDAKGENIRQLTTNDRSFTPRWSPDGKSILYVYEPYDHAEIHVMDADGNNSRRLVDDVDFGTIPSWSPDSRYITYGIGIDLYVLEVPSGMVFNLIIAGYAPIWSPIAGYAPIRSPIAVPQPTIAVPQPTDCSFNWTRLTVGNQALVMGKPSDPPNRVRSEPQKGDNLIGKLYPGAIVKIVDGPVCADGLVFWKVKGDSIPGGSGWTAEGDGIEYWLEPFKP